MSKENKISRMAGSVQNLQIHTGDCKECMHSFPEGSVGAICTDPPYG